METPGLGHQPFWVTHILAFKVYSLCTFFDTKCGPECSSGWGEPSPKWGEPSLQAFHMVYHELPSRLRTLRLPRERLVLLFADKFDAVAFQVWASVNGASVVWWEKDFLQGISVWKKNHHRESEFQMWKMTMADAMKKILNNQVLEFFSSWKKNSVFKSEVLFTPTSALHAFFFNHCEGWEGPSWVKKTIAFFRQATPAPVGHFQASNFRAQKSPPHFGQLQTCWPLIGWQL